MRRLSCFRWHLRCPGLLHEPLTGSQRRSAESPPIPPERKDRQPARMPCPGRAPPQQTRAPGQTWRARCTHATRTGRVPNINERASEGCGALARGRARRTSRAWTHRARRIAPYHSAPCRHPCHPRRNRVSPRQKSRARPAGVRDSAHRPLPKARAGPPGRSPVARVRNRARQRGRRAGRRSGPWGWRGGWKRCGWCGCRRSGGRGWGRSWRVSMWETASPPTRKRPWAFPFSSRARRIRPKASIQPSRSSMSSGGAVNMPTASVRTNRPT